MQANAQGWHTEKWGTWGWIETGLKLVAIAAGLFALARAFPDHGFQIVPNRHLAALILLTVLTLASVAQLAICFRQRETVSMLFAVLNLVGHLALWLSITLAPGQRTAALAFGVFYVLGQLAKVQFLRISGYTEGGANSASMLRVTGVITVIYIVFIILMLL